MALTLNRLTAVQLKKPKPGLHADGGGLYLRVSEGAKTGQRWVFIYRRPVDGKRCELGLGGLKAVSLAKARETARAHREILADGKDPRTILIVIDAAKPITFGQFADDYIATMQSSWRNAKHRAQWVSTLATHAKPLRDLPVDVIDTDRVLKVLQPLWTEIPETADRLRGRIEVILDAARAKGLRVGDNPARWRGHLKLVLPARQKLARGHHARLPIEDVPTFMQQLQRQSAIAARCLEFLVLTASRSGEASGAEWGEIDIGRAIWTVPAERMKSGRPHQVPLSMRALAILDEVRISRRDDACVFSGERSGKPMSDMALLMLLRRMAVGKATVHGFRSCFRDWAGNLTDFPRELAELALAHVIGDKAKQAYRRDTALERRRPLMEAWAGYCFSPPTEHSEERCQ